MRGGLGISLLRISQGLAADYGLVVAQLVIDQRSPRKRGFGEDFVLGVSSARVSLDARSLGAHVFLVEPRSVLRPSESCSKPNPGSRTCAPKESRGSAWERRRPSTRSTMLECLELSPNSNPSLCVPASSHVLLSSCPRTSHHSQASAFLHASVRLLVSECSTPRHVLSKGAFPLSSQCKLMDQCTTCRSHEAPVRRNGPPTHL